ncbi:MAG: divalent-cation tolerance protein CutA [Candidatus Omnitrophica bacterium]|nr:divalent-cation tolerance protein CutA [Candidatus Omnitrophota bacterium]
MFNIVLVTCPNLKEAEKIAAELVRLKLAACVSIIENIKSIYRWKGKIEQSKELLLIIKTKKSMVPKLIKKVRSLHSYEVPEIIAVPVTRGNSDYLEWINDSVR